MTEDKTSPKRPSEIAADERRARQEEALRENLKRRKDQNRARRRPPSAMGGAEDASAEAEAPIPRSGA